MKLFLFLLALGCPLFAQVSSATLAGTVRDPDGSVVPNATLELRRDTTTAERKGSSSSTGEYRFDNLSPGTYTLTASKDGFRSNTTTGILLAVNQNARLDVALTLGSASDAVTVTASITP